MFNSKKLIKLTKESYEKMATEFSQTRNYLWKDLEIFNEYIKKADNVLDVGCGNGRFLEFLKNKKVKYLGIDYSENLIKQARIKYLQEKFLVEDVLVLGRGDKRDMGDRGDKGIMYDVVVALAVLNHIPTKKLQLKFLQNLKKVLKPGGYILMTNWNLFNLKNKKSVWFNLWQFLMRRGVLTKWKSNSKIGYLFYYAFTLRKLKKLAKKVGLKVEHNFYSLKGEKSTWLRGQNLVTVLQNK